MNRVPAPGVTGVIESSGLGGLRPLIAAYIGGQRWSGARGAAVTALEFVDAADIPGLGCTTVFTLVRATLDNGRAARLALPVGLRDAGDALAERAPAFLIGDAEIGGRAMFAYDAVGDPAYVRWLWDAIRNNRTLPTAVAALRFQALDGTDIDGTEPDVRWLGAEQSNTSMELGTGVFLKHLRRIDEGPSHELEMAEALAAAGFEHRVPLTGTGVYAPASAEPSLLVLAQPYLHNATEGWALALTSLRDLYADAEEAPLAGVAEQRAAVDEQGGAFVAEAGRLGSVVAGMHRALASPGLPPAAAPHPLSRERLDGWAAVMTGELDRLLARPDPALQRLRMARQRIAARFDALRRIEPDGLCTRVHGDLHLGQVLRTDSGWFILDFEGEPDRTPEQRRERWSPLRDVAGMLRSFDYAAAAALAERSDHDHDGEFGDHLRALGDAWASVNRDAFWAAYLAGVDGTGLLPAPGAALTVRRAFEVQKAVYEVEYELGHRPGWVHIPIEFLLRGAG
jgi:trehalose synthase-fused probable maltokinase